MNLFGDTQAPRWLSIDERQSLYEKMASEETAGFGQAFQNAFNSAQNKDAAIAKQRLTGMEADNKLKSIAADEAQKEHAAWIKDQPTVVPWLMAPPDKRTTMDTPTPTSQTGIDAILKTRAADEQYLLRKQNSEWLNEYRKGQLDIKKDQLQHNFKVQSAKLADEGRLHTAFAALQAQHPNEAAVISSNFPDGVYDENGFILPEARPYITAAAEQFGIPISAGEEKKQEAEIASGSRERVAGIGAASREKVEGMRVAGAEKLEGMREKGRAEVEKAKGQLKTLQIQYNIKQKRLDNLAKDPVLAMNPDNMGKTMAAVRKKKEEELSKLSSEVDSLAEKMEVLSNQIETGPAEPGTDYRPGTMNAAPPPPKVNTPEQAKEAIDQANAALKKIGNNKELRQKVLDKLKQLGVDFTLGTNAPAASTNATANP